MHFLKENLCTYVPSQLLQNSVSRGQMTRCEIWFRLWPGSRHADTQLQ